MRHRAALLLVVFVLATGGCAATPEGAEAPDLGERILGIAAKGALKSAKFGRDMLIVTFIRFPELLGKIPIALIVDVPREIRLATVGTETRVEILMKRVEYGRTPKEIARAVRRVRETTGLPFEDAASWLAWWEKAKGQGADRWMETFVDEQLRDLDDEDYLIRDAADARLRGVAGLDVGYDAKGSEEERAEGRAKWIEWRNGRFGTD